MSFTWKENYTSMLTVLILLISVILLGITVYNSYKKSSKESPKEDKKEEPFRRYRSLTDAAAASEYYRYLLEEDALKK
jgi:predicted negative regulator of RcsB-dependent stress response